jgi:ABC-type nitrate/sulfonate/bicarbonate transport system substrate-binding protein
MQRRWISALLVALVIAVVVTNASAQEKLRLAWAGFSPTNSPIWVIEDRKLLQKMGVEPEIIAINASPTVLQTLLAGEIDAASISVTTLTSSRLQGADTVMIVGVVPTFVDHIVSLSSITAVEQLKGKTGQGYKDYPHRGHRGATRGAFKSLNSVHHHPGAFLDPSREAWL